MDLRNLHIQEATEQDTDDILNISSIQLGHSYLSKSELGDLMKSNNCRIPVLRRKGQMIGYSIIFLDAWKNLDHYGLAKCRDALNLNAEARIQLRKSTAIHPEFTKKGYGIEFVRRSMKQYNHGVELVMSVNWKRGDIVPMDSISRQLGMKILCEIDGYWDVESRQKKVECPECGLPPCTCKAIIYHRRN